MKVVLTVTAGPHAGQQFTFDGHDTFLVGRTRDAHFRLSFDDPYFSRRHFLIEVNPPRVRVLDCKSRNGVRVNGRRVDAAELADGDEVRAGHTTFQFAVVPGPAGGEEATYDLPAPPPAGEPRSPTAGPGGGTPAAGTPPRTLTADPAGPPAADPPPGPPAVPGYRTEAEIGRGGMGVVYRAVRLADGRPVAVKTITPAAGTSQKHVDRFVREAHLLGRLSHPNIVGFVDAGPFPGGLFIAMDLEEGPDAGTLLRERGPLEVKAAVRLVRQALAGLAHAHAQKVVHRDVKPGNLLLGRGANGKRVVKVADFGLARAYEASHLSGVTLQGETGGTPVYMAPEQVTHFREVKPAADQYSAAATLYVLLTRKYTHDFEPQPQRMLVQLMTDDPVPVRDRRPELPAELAAVIHRALARDPADRFPDATAFRDALRPFGE